MTLDEILSSVYDEAQKPKGEAAKDPPTAEAPAEPAQTAKPEPTQSSSAIAAPQSWSAEHQAKFATLPPDVQKYVHERETQASQLISRQGAELKTFQPIREVYDWVRSKGVPPGQEAQVIQNWASYQNALDNPQSRVEAFRSLAQSYGLDLAQLAGQPKQPDANAAVDDLFKDPRVDTMRAEMQREIHQLRQQLGQVGGQVTAREQAEQQQRTQYVADAVQRFASDPSRTHFSALEDEITHEVNFIKAREPGLPIEKVLEKAYDRAVYANPQIRDRVLSEQRKAEADKAQKELADKQAAAKKHAAMNVRTGASASTPRFDGRWDDKASLGALYDKITSA